MRRADLVRPQIVLVDLQLPDGTGIEVLRALRERLPETRAIVLTSFDDDDALAAALDEGAAAYLLKSVRGAEITEVIRAVAAGRTLLDQRTVTRHKARHDDPTDGADPQRAARRRAHRRGDVQPGDRGAARHRREDREEPHHVRAREDGAAAPHPGRGVGGVAGARGLAGRAGRLSRQRQG